MKYQIKTIKDEQTYQHTGIMILIKAIKDLYNNPEVVVANSLNQGFFVYFNRKDGKNLSGTDVNRIRQKMQSIVRQDISIRYEWVPCREAVRIWREEGYEEKARLFEKGNPEQLVLVYDLDGYRDYFYSEMLPSTGYLEVFELRPYKNGLLLRHPTVLNPDRCQTYRDDDKLYEAFADGKRMRKLFHLDYLADLNDRTEDELREIIRGSEEYMEKEICDIAERVVCEGRRMVLIAGPSSSGKTTFAKKLCRRIGELSGAEPIYLGTDDYFKDRDEVEAGPDGDKNFEGIDVLDLDLFNSHMAALLAGEEVDVPEYDFVNGRKVYGRRFISAGPEQAIVVEGIHSLNDVLTEDIPADDKFRIYISPLTRISIDAHNRLSTTDARLLRRMVRDKNYRGVSAAATIHEWPKVRAGENENIFPYSPVADAVFNSSLVYETSLLKHFAVPLLQGITEDQPEYEEARRILEFTNCFRTIDIVDAVPEDSILREFIGHQGTDQ